MRPGDTADYVKCIVDISYPVPDRLVHSVLEGLAAGLYRVDLRAQQLHTQDVRGLTHDVFAAHIDLALKTEERRDRGRGHSVLPGAGLGDDALFTHTPGKQDLTYSVIDLMRARMAEVLALQINISASCGHGQTLRKIERRRPADILAQIIAKLFFKGRVVLELLIGLFKLNDRRHERLRDIPAAEPAVVP